jgi:hypothetical protein
MLPPWLQHSQAGYRTRRAKERNGCAFGLGKPSDGHVRLSGTFIDADLHLHPIDELAVIELLL